jgi:hypothetical protein
MLSSGTGSGAFGWSVARLRLCVNWRRRKNFGSFLGEVVMKGFWGRHTGLALGALIGSVVASTLAQADGVAAGPGPISAQKMWLSCENGRDYPLHPLAVSREFDLVTGYLLVTGHGRGVHMRLIPMGSGYRYAGPGVWFDGMRGQAVLNWGRPDEVPCKVMQE